MITGSDTPAFSLFLAASEYVAPVAMILVSSSDKAIHVSNGADRSASSRAIVCGDISSAE